MSTISMTVLMALDRTRDFRRHFAKYVNKFFLRFNECLISDHLDARGLHDYLPSKIWMFIDRGK